MTSKTLYFNYMAKEKTSSWGGAREGAGRKPKATEGSLRVAFRCSQDVYDILQLVQNKTAYIEAAIREKHRREELR
jgi:hypothetical protein